MLGTQHKASLCSGLPGWGGAFGFPWALSPPPAPEAGVREFSLPLPLSNKKFFFFWFSWPCGVGGGGVPILPPPSFFPPSITSSCSFFFFSNLSLDLLRVCFGASPPFFWGAAFFLAEKTVHEREHTGKKAPSCMHMIDRRRAPPLQLRQVQQPARPELNRPERRLQVLFLRILQQFQPQGRELFPLLSLAIHTAGSSAAEAQNTLSCSRTLAPLPARLLVSVQVT